MYNKEECQGRVSYRELGLEMKDNIDSTKACIKMSNDPFVSVKYRVNLKRDYRVCDDAPYCATSYYAQGTIILVHNHSLMKLLQYSYFISSNKINYIIVTKMFIYSISYP